MRVIDHGQEAGAGVAPLVSPRACGCRPVTGAAQLCVFEQWCDPGCGAPTHLHAVEEVLSVLIGEAEMWVGEERATVTTGQSVVVPAGRPHGFRNTGTGTLHVQAVLAAPIFEAAFEDARETSRRWLPAS
jgi:mannose-6-phosphate isomerase-like protein (cupin superfamily)